MTKVVTKKYVMQWQNEVDKGKSTFSNTRRRRREIEFYKKYVKHKTKSTIDPVAVRDVGKIEALYMAGCVRAIRRIIKRSVIKVTTFNDRRAVIVQFYAYRRLRPFWTKRRPLRNDTMSALAPQFKTDALVNQYRTSNLKNQHVNQGKHKYVRFQVFWRC